MQFRGAKVILRDGLEVTDQVRRDMYNAWLQLQNLHRTHPGLQYKSITSAKGWRVSSMDGKDQIELLGYQYAEKKEEKEEIKFKSEYEFIPGICMIAEEDYKRYAYGYKQLDSAYISVCATPTWEGTLVIIPDSELVDEPGEKWPDSPAQGIIGLLEYGYQGWDYWFDSGWDVTAETITDTGFNPVPYLGNSLINGFYDYGLDVLYDQPGSLYTGANYLNGCGEQLAFYEAWRDEVNADPDWGFVDGTTQFNDDNEICLDMGADGCCDEIQGAMHYLAKGKCGKGHLFFDLDISWHQCWALYDAYDIGGICYGYSSTIDKELTNGITHQASYGEAQDRLYTDTYKANVYIITDAVPDRAAGEITSSISEHQEIDIHRLKMPAICEEVHIETYYKYAPYTYTNGIPGAYVSDSAAGGNLLQDKYLIVYVENVYEVPTCILTDDEWNLPSGYPKYVSSSVYADGTPSSVPGSCSSLQYDILFADVNGVKVEIDRSSIGDIGPYFYITDSHVLTIGGNTYYMYAYIYMRYISGKLNTDRIRYGYFKNTGANHIRSPLFSSAGLLSTSGGYTTVHHDVNGSINFPTPLYGIGKCAGFFRKRVKEYV